MPGMVYKTKTGKVIYLTGDKIAKLLRKVVKEVRLDTTACILLDEAGKLLGYIKKRLC
jgi:hypothetical protein